MQHLQEVEPGSWIRVRLQGHEDIADGVYKAQVDFVHDDHLLVWIAESDGDRGEVGGFTVAVMEANEDGVWSWSKRSAL